MKILFFLRFTKREKFVLSVLVLSAGFFISEFFGANSIKIGFSLALLTDLFLFLILKNDIHETFYYPIFILPFIYTISFNLFNLLVPERFLSKIILTSVYAFGLYSLFLTQNIFAVSSIRTINLLRSARIVSSVITILIIFFLINFIFLSHAPIFIMPILVFIIAFILNFQSFWAYSLDKQAIKDVILFSILNSLCLAELSSILTLWPLDATIYSIFLTGIFYAFSGLSHAWFEKRLFKGVLWEYIWVGFLSIVILIFFSKWGI